MRTAAIAFVVEAGRRDGNEHAVLLDARSGKIVASYTSGDPCNVNPDGDEEIIALLDDAARPLEMVHNHPRDCSLSLEDLRFQAENAAVRSVVAASHDGSIYEGRALAPRRDREKAGEKFRRRWNKKVPPMSLDFEPRHAFHHLRNVFLAKKGLARYAFVLSPSMAALVEKTRAYGATAALGLESRRHEGETR